MSIRFGDEEVDCGLVLAVSIRFGLSLSLSDTKMSDDAAIWVIHLLEEVSPSPTAIGRPNKGTWSGWTSWSGEKPGLQGFKDGMRVCRWRLVEGDGKSRRINGPCLQECVGHTRCHKRFDVQAF